MPAVQRPHAGTGALEGWHPVPGELSHSHHLGDLREADRDTSLTWAKCSQERVEAVYGLAQQGCTAVLLFLSVEMCFLRGDGSNLGRSQQIRIGDNRKMPLGVQVDRIRRSL